MMLTGTNEKKLSTTISLDYHIRARYIYIYVRLSLLYIRVCHLLMYYYILTPSSEMQFDFLRNSVSYNLIILICDLVTVGSN